MQTNVNTLATMVPKAHAPAANTAAIITLAAASGTRHVVDKIFGGYDSIPTNGTLTIASTVSGAAVSMVMPITSAGPIVLNINPPLQGDDNTAITITLAAGGAGVAGTINALTR